ncbi:MAG: DUF1588 domain-containing protein [Lentisphaeraceae bacterium]|nr:DUF1588 domain-containing protein [Lentisphaeraceae bacterium]
MVRSQLALLFLLVFCGYGWSQNNFQKDIKPILSKYCYKCHDADTQKGDLRLDLAHSEDDLIKHRKEWLRSLELIKEREMPPKKPFPSQLEIEKLTTYLDKTLHNYDWSKIKNPGFVSMSRLTNIEYQNSVSNVFNLEFFKNVSLIKDAEGDSGFTNDRDNLGLSTNALIKYIEEAEQYVDAYLSYRQKPYSQNFNLELKGKKRLSLGHNKSKSLAMIAPFTGVYLLTLDLSSNRHKKTGIEVYVNNSLVFSSPVNGLDPKLYEVPIFLKKGSTNLVIYYSEKAAALFSDKRIKEKAPEKIYKATFQAFKKAPKVPIPAQHKNNPKYKAAYNEINKKIANAHKSLVAADLLLQLPKLPDDRSMLYGLEGVLKCKQAQKILNISDGAIKQMVAKAINRNLPKECGEKLKEFNKKYDALYGHKNERAGNLSIGKVALAGPYLSKNSKDPRRLLSKVTNKETARKLLYYYAVKAFKRQVSQSDLEPMIGVFDKTFNETKSLEHAFRDALVTLITSPKFMLHRNTPPKTGTEIDNFQKVSRLSYFLWQTIPDASLLRMARDKTIAKPENTRKQIQRMIADERFENFCKTFTTEWLNIDNINGVSIYLKQLMQKEPEMLISKVFKENRNIFELIDADYTFLNEHLARHYDLPGITGDEMRLVKLKDKTRGGLVTMGGVLAATSLPRRTSPVHRGAWIVDTIFGEELPLPPDNVPELPAKVPGAKTLREKLERHRKDPNCASCHARIDPYGFALENYDNIGRWRDNERRGVPIDSSMILKNGIKTNDISGFKKYLLKYKGNDIRRSLIERVLSYALGRKLQYYDEPAIQKIITHMKKNKDKSHSLIEGVILSYPFWNQKIQEDQHE